MANQQEGKSYLNGNYPLLSEAEMQELQQKYLSRLNDVAVSCEFAKHALKEFNELEVARARKEHWDHYVTCSELPRPFDPGEMRTVPVKRRYFSDIETDKTIDWTLLVDERSILNQNIFRDDRTRASLQIKLGKEPGVAFDRDIQMCLDTIKKIDVMLDNQAEVERMSLNLQLQVFEVRTDYEHEIDRLFDRLAYRILTMQPVYMKSVDAREATWSYKCKTWTMDLWGLTNADVRFEHLDIPAMIADLRATGVTVQMPLSVLKDCLTVRCIHTSFDTYSQNAKSYEHAIPEGNSYPDAGLLDIEESLMSEWHIQMEMREMVLAVMVRRRLQYLQTLQLIEERTDMAAKMARNQNQGNSKVKIPKIVVPKTPKLEPEVPEGMMPDIQEAFYQQEELDYKKYIDWCYHPKKLHLTKDEINLREHIVVGGIYSIMFVHRPMQTQFHSFNVVLHEDGQILHTMPNVVAKVEERFSKTPNLSRARLTATPDVRKSNIRLQDNELPYFIVTIQLPKGLCNWSDPLICQYLTDMVHTKEKTASNRSSGISQDPVDGQIRTSSILKNPLRDSERSSQPSNIFRFSQLSVLRQSKLDSITAMYEPLDNFNLDKVLNLMEIRNLEKYSMPRILSSFKLPTDLADEDLELELKDKGQGKLLIKREQDQEENVARPIRTFEFESQNKPECIFPFFANSQNFKSTQDTNRSLDTSFHGFMNTLENIKGKYMSRPYDLIRQCDAAKADKKDKKDKKVVGVADSGPTRYSFRRSTGITQPRGSSVKLDMIEFSENKDDSDSSETNGPMKAVVHWTTKHIVKSVFDREANTLTITTDRLGIFGLAFNRYEHFPFRDWSLQPNDEDPDEVIFQLDTYHVRIFLYITAKGVRGYVTDLGSGYVANPVKYLEIVEPISDFREFRKMFVERNINIFAENDACFYIGRDYFSVKHVAAELHIYDAMALHCKLMKFYHSSWNALSSRRDIIVGMKIAKDPSDYTESTMRITPDCATFVKISELCSDDVNVIRLDYKNTWRNVNRYTDLHQAICSMTATALDMCNKDTLCLYFIRRLLGEICILSYS